MRVTRKKFIRSFLLLAASLSKPISFFNSTQTSGDVGFKRVRPGDATWPSADAWDQLNKAVNGNLVRLKNPFEDDNAQLFKNIHNPYFINSDPSLTQTLGWVDAWQSKPSVYSVEAKSTSDVVAAVNFARKNRLRLVIKGGGHSYLGNSSSPDSLLIWTKNMHSIQVQEHFIPTGCESTQAAQPAVAIEAGAIWAQVYNEVMTKNGRYVQGGGCLTVGVCGLIQGGGFGSFSKYYGLAAAGLLQAEVVLADGSVQVVNACNHPDLFWALKGGGGGSFGVVTKLVVRTRELPEFFGVVVGRIKAKDDDAYKKLIEKTMLEYRDKLFNPVWGEQIRFHSDRSVSMSMLFHGLTKNQAQDVWRDFENWTKENASDYSWTEPFGIFTLPARHMWDPAFLRNFAKDTIGIDDQPGAAPENIYWKEDGEQAGQFIHGYHSGWLSKDLLKDENIPLLTNAIYETSMMWSFAFHFNKGLAGTRPEEREAAANTSINPSVLDAFALLILAGTEGHAMPGFAGHEPNLQEARKNASAMRSAMEHLKKMIHTEGSYLNETDYFEENWQESFWGSNYKKLLAVKNKYD
ncbi:MAG TPA: FAD-binding protein, partial [Puia sp.]|nr:FAD-binding protein [Puia sp.]